MDARAFPFDSGKRDGRAGRVQYPLRTFGRATLSSRSSAGFFQPYIHFITHVSSTVRLQCIRRLHDTYSATLYLTLPHSPLTDQPDRSLIFASPIHSSFWSLCDGEPQFNELMTSAVHSKLKKLKHDFRCTCTNKAWLSAGGHDGHRHADTDSKVSQDPMPPRSLLLPLSPPLHSSFWSLCDGEPQFNELMTSAVHSKLKKLKHDFRCTCTNKAWLSAGGHDGHRHADTDSKVSQDPMPPRSLLPLSPPLHSSCWSPYAGTLPFGEFVLSDVCSKLTKLTGHAVRSTYTNKAWLCVGEHDGTKHPGTGCGIFRDFTSTPSPPPSPDTCHTHAHAPAPTIRVIYIRLATARAVTLF